MTNNGSMSMQRKSFTNIFIAVMGTLATKAVDNPQLFLFYAAKIWYDVHILEQ